MRVRHIIVFVFAFFSLMPVTARSQNRASTDRPNVHDSTAGGESPPTSQPRPRDTAGITLSDLKQMALQNNPTLSQAQARVQAARGKWQQVGFYPNPVIGYSGGEIGNDGFGGQQGGFVGQEFVTAGKLRLSRAMATEQIARLQQELAAQQFRVLTDVQTNYYQVLIAQRKLELIDQLVNLAKQGLRAAEALLKAKEGSRVDLLQARVESNTASILLKNAQNRHQATWRRLAAVVGTPGLAAERLAGDVEEVGSPLHWEDALSRVLSESPELAAAAAEVQAARWGSQRARVEWIPNVNVQATFQHDNASGDDITGVQLAIPLPLFNRNQGNIVAADSQLAGSLRNVERVRLSLRNRLAEVYRRYANAAGQVEKYRTTILPDAKETLDLVAEGYQQGEFSYLNLLMVQRTYFQSNLTYLESLSQLKSSQAQIEGLLLNDSLNSSPAGQQMP